MRCLTCFSYPLRSGINNFAKTIALRTFIYVQDLGHSQVRSKQNTKNNQFFVGNLTVSHSIAAILFIQIFLLRIIAVCYWTGR